jgi:hypothetical protein
MPSGASVVAEVAPARLTERGQSPEELLADMAALGFVPAALTNDYHPASYTVSTVAPPVPLRGVPAEMTDVVFTKAGGAP